MLNFYLEQSKHNQELLDKLNKEDFFNDWKCTLCFYIAIHKLKALGAKMELNLGNNHEEIFKSINPKTLPKLNSNWFKFQKL